MSDNPKVEGQMSLSPDLQELVDQASRVVWKVERPFVRRTLTNQLPAPSARRFNEIQSWGVESAALNLAGAFWSLVAGALFMLLVLPELFFYPSESFALKFAFGAIVVCAFLLAFFRFVMSRRSRSKDAKDWLI
jgi:hypothetical protein